MTIEYDTFYWLRCSECGHRSNDEDAGYLGASEAGALKDAKDKGWLVYVHPAGDNYICPLCQEHSGWHE